MRTQSNQVAGLTRVRGIRVGHFTDPRRPTGCTVVLCEEGAVAGVDVRGSAPGTRETDLLNPVNTVQEVHAVILSGGSAFGLETATGVTRYLEEKRIGYPTRAGRVPIVPAAILFDLGIGDSSIRPDAEAGYQACVRASDGHIAEGNVGAGAGATAGKLLGFDRAMKAGLGTASLEVENLVVAALAAANPVGDIVDPESGQILAGARGEEKGQFADLAQTLRTTLIGNSNNRTRKPAGENTVLVVVATNAAFDKAAMTKVAQMAHAGLARAVRPSHMPADGDTIFALSTGEISQVDLGQVGALAADVTARAIVRAALEAEGLPGLPAHRNWVEDPSLPKPG